MEPIRLDPTVCTLARVASRDTTRPTLCSVRMAGRTAVATDGHRLATLTLPESADPMPELLADSETLRSLETTVRKAHAVAELGNGGPEESPYRITIRTDGKPGQSTIALPQVDGAFPDYEHVIPKPNGTHRTAYVNAAYLRELADVVERFHGKGVTAPVVALHVPQHRPGERHTLSPVVMTATRAEGGAELLVLLMPCRPGLESEYSETGK